MAVDWFSKARIYHIFIDRFAGCDAQRADKPVFAGGNLIGIVEHLDHIASMGFTAIWLSPFYKGVAYHGYHITDFFEVDERFGSLQDLKTLIAEAHRRKLYVIADFVPNHCSVQHPFFVDASSNVRSQYRSWFYFDSYPNDYRAFLDFKELPKLNLRNKDTARHLLDSAQFWLKLGIDGFRIDHVLGVPRSFLKQLRRELKQINPQAILFGEVWTEGLQAHHYKLIDIQWKWWHRIFGLSQYAAQRNYIGVLDGVLDFEARSLLLQYVAQASTITFDLIQQRLQRHLDSYPKDFRLVLFLDNHDTNRFLFEANNEKLKLLTALKLLASANQPLILYYGTEACLSQSEALSFARPHADLAVRQAMPWAQIDAVMTDEIRRIMIG